MRQNLRPEDVTQEITNKKYSVYHKQTVRDSLSVCAMRVYDESE